MTPSAVLRGGRAYERVAYQIARRVWRCRTSSTVLVGDVVVVGRGEGE